MKLKDVLKLLQITRPTLTKYVKEGKLKVQVLGNDRYDYIDEDVYKFLNKDLKRQTVIYARVSSKAQKQYLQNQVETLKQFCFNQGYILNAVYEDITSGISFEKRTSFFKMLDDIINHKIERVVISYKDRLSRIGFGLFKTLFAKFGCQIIVMSEVGSNKLDSEEIFEEIVSMLHCYSMKLYAKRSNDKKKVEIEIG